MKKGCMPLSPQSRACGCAPYQVLPSGMKGLVPIFRPCLAPVGMNYCSSLTNKRLHRLGINMLTQQDAGAGLTSPARETAA